jgi:hypothetical protein
VLIGTCPQRLSRGRRLAWAWFRAITGLRIEDLTSGFRAYGPQAIRVLASREATCSTIRMSGRRLRLLPTDYLATVATLEREFVFPAVA